MLIGVPRETKQDEHRVGLTPTSVRELAHNGHTLLIESGAGDGIGASDADYTRAGARIVRSSIGGLMDAALPPEEVRAVEQALGPFMTDGVGFHALRTRQAGARRFVSLHVLVPGTWSVQRGHDLVERIESALRERLPGISVLSHLEPAEDPSSWDDTGLDRDGAA